MTTSNSDLGPGQQQTDFPELLQDEDVGHHWRHSHDLWSLLVILQLPVCNDLIKLAHFISKILAKPLKVDVDSSDIETKCNNLKFPSCLPFSPLFVGTFAR